MPVKPTTHLVLCAVALLSAGGSAAAQEVHNRDYVYIGTTYFSGYNTFGPPQWWWLKPFREPGTSGQHLSMLLELRVAPGSTPPPYHVDYVFYIERVGSQPWDRTALRHGDRVRIRGVTSSYFRVGGRNHDPWLMVEAGNPNRVRVADKHEGNPQDPTVLRLSGITGQPILYGEDMFIEGTQGGTRYIVAPNDPAAVGMVTTTTDILDQSGVNGLFQFARVPAALVTPPPPPPPVTHPGPPPAPPQPPGNPDARPVFRWWTPGSAIVGFARSESSSTYRCAIELHWAYDSFGQEIAGSGTNSIVIAPNTPETKVYDFSGSYVHLHLTSDPVVECVRIN